MDYSLLIGVKREKFTVMASTSSTNSLKHRTDSQIADEMGLQRRVTGEQIETGGGVSKPAWKMFGELINCLDAWLCLSIFSMIACHFTLLMLVSKC